MEICSRLKRVLKHRTHILFPTKAQPLTTCQQDARFEISGCEETRTSMSSIGGCLYRMHQSNNRNWVSSRVENPVTNTSRRPMWCVGVLWVGRKSYTHRQPACTMQFYATMSLWVVGWKFMRKICRGMGGGIGCEVGLLSFGSAIGNISTRTKCSRWQLANRPGIYEHKHGPNSRQYPLHRHPFRGVASPRNTLIL